MRYLKVKDFKTNTICTDMIKRIDDDGQEWFIPFSQGNADYEKYLAWLAEGNQPEEAE